MEGVRVVTNGKHGALAPCSRCQASGCPWDRIADRPMCPDCQETLIGGDGPPLVEKAEKKRCALCSQTGTLRYLTYPLHVSDPVEMDLCPRHFQALLGRRLDHVSFYQLGRQLEALGVAARQVFLLHEAFYDSHGRPLQPVAEPY
jgi:hypothetical protein